MAAKRKKKSEAAGQASGPDREEEQQPQVVTEGGATTGSVSTGGGDFVGRDQIVEGDAVSVGDVQNAAGVAIGTGAQAIHIEATGPVDGNIFGAEQVTVIQQTAQRPRATRRQAVRPFPGYIPRIAVEEQLKQILVAPAEGPKVVGLTGLPGVGLTLVARSVATSLDDAFPDGTLWADMQATTIKDALWRFVEPYESSIDRASLRTAGEYLETLRRVLGDKRVLIVLDHVEALGTLQAVIPSGCPHVVILVVSRAGLTGHVPQANLVYVPEMTPEESEALFRTIWKETPRLESTPSDTILALAHELHFLPAQMAPVAQDILNSQVMPEEYLQELRRRSRSREEQAQEFEAGFEVVFAKLGERGRRLLPYAGVLGAGGWRFDALVTVSQMGRNEVDAGLRQLLATGLVQQRAPGRFVISPAVSVFAQNRLVESGGQTMLRALQRILALYYLDQGAQFIASRRQELAAEFIGKEERHRRYMDALTPSLERAGKDVPEMPRLKDIDLALLQTDPLREAFEMVVLSESEYQEKWSEVLAHEELQEAKPHLEMTLDQAVEQEDWSMARRFADFTLAEWFLNGSVSGDKNEQGRGWVTIEFNFGLIRSVDVTGIYVNTYLRATRVIDATWTDCDFLSAKWLGVHVLRSDFTEVDLVGAALPGTVLRDCTLTNVDARLADCRGVVFQNCSLTGVNFRNANLEGVEFVDCDFTEVDFRGTRFESLGTEGLLTGEVSGRIYLGAYDDGMQGLPR